MDLKALAKSNIAATYKKNYDCHLEGDPIQVLLDDMYEYIDPSSRYMHRLRINLFTDLMKELQKENHFQNKENALDIGCNRGFYSKLISDFGFKNVRGIDIDQPLLDKANEYFRSESPEKTITFDNFNAEELALESKYDFILCTEVIEHTARPEKVIEFIKTGLKPGGIAIITLPNAFSYPYLLTWLSYKLHRRPFNAELRDHLSYPFYRAISLFKDERMELIRTTGTNLYHWYFLHKVPGFKILSKLNYQLSNKYPLKYMSQFFFMVLRKK